MTDLHESVRIVRELDGWRGRACLVERAGEFFIVSSVAGETLAFRAGANGEAVNMLEVAGGRGMSREETIDQLEHEGPEDYS
jgi:hypothetical protein